MSITIAFAIGVVVGAALVAASAVISLYFF